jgi:hypothetical protein
MNSNLNMTTSQPITFRFKFSANISEAIEEFSNIHKYDDTHDFRDAWDIWKQENENVVEREQRYLTSLGWSGNLEDKMYKSARYYFKNKSTKKKEAKKRRQYVTLDKKFLADMDKHINEVAFTENMKPAHAYNNFTSRNEYSNKMDEQVEYFQNHDWKEVDILNKIKKTYKNRYFIQQKKNSSN